MNKLIFISSPYSHTDPNVMHENFEKVSKFAASLIAQGSVAFTPIAYGHTLAGFNKNMPVDWEYWKNFCLTFLQHTDLLIVYKMDGWDKSRGVEEEIRFAQENNIPVIYQEYLPL